MSQRLSRAEFEQVVRLTPLVSIDLVIRSQTGRVLVGRRNNEPAKGQFFVPGGRILKDETLDHAFSRLVDEELGLTRQRSEAHSLGVYEHFYPTNALGTQGFGTHYVVLGFELRVDEEKLDLPKSQHSEYKWMTEREALDDPEVHSNTKAYFQGKQKGR